MTFPQINILWERLVSISIFFRSHMLPVLRRLLIDDTRANGTMRLDELSLLIEPFLTIEVLLKKTLLQIDENSLRLSCSRF